MIQIDALFKISYGLYIVSSGDKEQGNGFISNTVFQVTASPAQFAACCNKDNYTAEFIKKYGCFAVSVLEQNTASEIIGMFGYKSGRDTNKLEGMNVTHGETGAPIVLNNAIAFLECKVVNTIDVGTHLMFIGELVSAEVIDDTEEPLTYTYYRNIKNGKSPKNAPTYISEELKRNGDVYECNVCGYAHADTNEATSFNDLPDDWVCPVCGAPKSEFSKK